LPSFSAQSVHRYAASTSALIQHSRKQRVLGRERKRESERERARERGVGRTGERESEGESSDARHDRPPRSAVP
jgi:hypothetical protein